MNMENDLLEQGDVRKSASCRTRSRRRQMLRQGLIALASILSLFCTVRMACDSERAAEILSFKGTAINDGNALQLKWTVEDGLYEGFNLYIFDPAFPGGRKHEVLDTLARSYDVHEPCRRFWINAWEGEFESRSFPLDCRTAVTQSLTIYALSDSTNPEHKCHGLLLERVDGTAWSLGYDDPDRSRCAYALVDSGDSLFLVAATDAYYRGHFWGANAGKAVQVEEDFDNLKTCPDGSADWSRRVRLVAGETYALDASSNNLSGFAKMQVKEINGKGVTLRVGVQMTEGLRWVITNQ